MDETCVVVRACAVSQRPRTTRWTVRWNDKRMACAWSRLWCGHSVPRGPRGELVSLKHHSVVPPTLCEKVSCTDTSNSASHHHATRRGGQGTSNSTHGRHAASADVNSLWQWSAASKRADVVRGTDTAACSQWGGAPPTKKTLTCVG